MAKSLDEEPDRSDTDSGRSTEDSTVAYVRVEAFIRAIASLKFVKHDDPFYAAANEICCGFFAGALGHLRFRGTTYLYSPADVLIAMSSLPDVLGKFEHGPPAVDEVAKHGCEAIPDAFWQYMFLENGWFEVGAAKGFCLKKKWDIPIILGGIYEPEIGPNAVAISNVRDWFKSKQQESPEWTKPIDDWVEDATREFPRLTSHQAKKICREVLAVTGAKWLQRGRPRKPKNDKPATK